jgi:hypothetical protein
MQPQIVKEFTTRPYVKMTLVTISPTFYEQAAFALISYSQKITSPDGKDIKVEKNFFPNLKKLFWTEKLILKC